MMPLEEVENAAVSNSTQPPPPPPPSSGGSPSPTSNTPPPPPPTPTPGANTPPKTNVNPQTTTEVETTFTTVFVTASTSTTTSPTTTVLTHSSIPTTTTTTASTTSTPTSSRTAQPSHSSPHDTGPGTGTGGVLDLAVESPSNNENNFNLVTIGVSSAVGGVVLFLGVFLAARFLYVGRVRAKIRRQVEKEKMKERITGTVLVQGSGPVVVGGEEEGRWHCHGLEMVPILMVGDGHGWNGKGLGPSSGVGEFEGKAAAAASMPGPSVRYHGGNGQPWGPGGQGGGFI
ncbi:hypothetical protein C8A03DRAFT_36722 [Achaetomium macrosporum]|uniref:Uncharacterized protein n=1 Tax=Achaetomium macrosporum TaxID=79813 RepID=A0AAN7HC02_9PEZI|nr:hypothetical protein C8A03DRAFT_36722 [Achaetomium macrosporum]